MKFLFLYFLLFGSILSFGAKFNRTQNFLYIGCNGDQIEQYQKKIESPKIDGVQIMYTWKQLEPEKDKYDFSLIQSNLVYLEKQHKKLFIQIQDRFFSPKARNIPSYLLNSPKYSYGLTVQVDNPGENMPQVEGWATVQWNPNVRERFQKLIKALAENFDGKIYGINLPETALDIDPLKDKTNFTYKKYFEATVENILKTRSDFKKSYVVQYINFFPGEWDNDHGYMSTFFDLAINYNIGIGGPDVIPFNKAQMHNSYPFFHKLHDKLSLVSMAVQEGDYSYNNPKTGKKFTQKEFYDFAVNYLGANIIFWDYDHYQP